MNDNAPELPSEKPDAAQTDSPQTDAPEVRMADPLDLVYGGGYAGNPREIVENPAVAPQMLTINQGDADDLRDDMLPANDEDEQD
jgi:hypothetical protein